MKIAEKNTNGNSVLKLTNLPIKFFFQSYKLLNFQVKFDIRN